MKTENATDYRLVDDPESHASKFLHLLYDEDELLGLFVLDAEFPSSKCPCGFYYNRETFLGQVDELNRRGNIYINLNELHSDLYGRSAEAFKTYARQRYSDTEVVRRKRLLVDCDPERLSGINSTQEELDNAIDRAKIISGYLLKNWGIEPVLIISGNGAQLLYRINEPSESDLVAKILQHLSEAFSDERVHVDTGVGDAARITRLPGAVNMKGSDIPERPQRYAQILSAPESMDVVTTEQLTQLVQVVEKPVKQQTPAQTASPKEDWTHERIESFLGDQYKSFGEHGWDYKIVDSDKFGIMYKIQQCPFVQHRDEYRYRAAVWLNDGTPCFKCFSDDCDGEDKKTFSDFLQKIAPELDDTRPAIFVTTDEEQVVNQAVMSLASCENLYQRAGILVRIERNATPPTGILRSADTPSIAILPKPTLREKLASAAKWKRVTDEGYKDCHPPHWSVEAVNARTSWPIRVLEAIAGTPFLRADGSVADSYGYDRQTGVFCDYEGTLPPLPTVEKACEQLQGLVCDFPFTTEPHKSAWIAGLLTPLAKHAFAGPSPLFLVDANTPGSGKSLLTDVISLVTTGQPMSRMSAPSADDEWRKRITSLVISGDPLVLIDNIVGTLGTAALDAALTGESWTDRVLGASRIVTLPLAATWYATGNNVLLARDTARRTLHIRMDCNVENPEQRSDFTIPNLIGHVREERQKYVAAALAILTGYCQAGRPGMKLPPWGSFEGWSDLVRSSIVWAGLPDPGETRLELARQSDTESELVQQLITGWSELDPARLGLTIAKAVTLLSTESEHFSVLRDVCRSRTGRNPKQTLTQLLRKYRGRIAGGKMIENRDQGNVKAWFVQDVS